MNSKPSLCGLVLAGGRSSRMGRDKAALIHPDGRTLVRRCCDLLREAGCEIVAVSLRADQWQSEKQGAAICLRPCPRCSHSESPAHGTTMKSDSLKTLAHHGHGESEFATPCGSHDALEARSALSLNFQTATQEIPAGLENVEIVRDPAGASHGPMAGIIAGMRLRPESNWLVVACDLPRLDLKTLTHLIASLQADEKFLAYRSEFDGLPEPLCTLYAPAALPVLAQAQADDFRCPRKILIRNECRLLDPVTLRALDNANTPEDWETARIP